MKQRIAIIAVIMLLVGIGGENIVTAQSTPKEESPGADLRRLVLTTPVEKLGFAADEDYPAVYGVLAEWDIDGVTATVMSMRDGTASLYTTSTFGIIGGQGHASVRQAAARYVKLANKFAATGKPVTEFPYPKGREVFFYLLTYSGILQVTGDIAAIERESDPTHPLFWAAQDVLTELRLITEKEDAQPET